MFTKNLSTAIIAILFLSPLLSINAQKDNFDFRKTKWGMSKQEVKKAETATFLQPQGNGLVYEGKLAGLDVYIFYMFGRNKLAMTSYMFIEKHSNKNDYINDYNKLKKLLTKKYGEPYNSKTAWKKDLYKNDPQEYGFAVSLGHLAYYSNWSHVGTEIELRLFGDNYKIMHGVNYTSKVYSDYLKSDIEKEELEGL